MLCHFPFGNCTYFQPILLYTSDALGRFIILAMSKLYTSSNNIKLHNKMLMVKNNFLFNFFDILIHIGKIIYINIKDDIPKNRTLLKQTNPPMLPKFNISVL